MNRFIKKIVAVATVLTVFSFVAGPAFALTAEELQASINLLMTQLTGLQAQLAILQGTPTGTTACTITSFDTNLSQGMTGEAVKCLQKILNSSTDTQVASSGAGSPGNETTYFGALTKAAVIIFQQKHASEILTPVGLTTGTGLVGPKTRAKLNTMLGVVIPPTGCTTNVNCPTNYICSAGSCVYVAPPPTGGGLSVSLAFDTPVSMSIADNSNANFTKVNFTAGSSDVTITKMYITRSGLALNADVENIKIVDTTTGVNAGSVGSLNVDSRSLITFTPGLKISAGTTKSYFLRAGIKNDTVGGKTIALGIASASDIISNASSVTGTFPATGNLMTVVLIATGTATIVEDGTTVDSQPDVGTNDVTINQFKISAGSTESLTVEQITAMKTGTSATDDTINIELYDVTASKTLGTVASWDAEGKAGWNNLGIVIAKGESHRFKIMVDIIGGSGLTVNGDVKDGSDWLVTVKGNTYGYFITPTGTWTGYGSNSGTGTNNQTIQTGTLTIVKSGSTPSTGSIAPADNQSLVTFDFITRGEEVKISSFKVSFNLTAGFVNDTDETQITNVKLYDQAGLLVAGPLDLGTTDYNGPNSANDYEGYVTFTDTFIVPVGTHKYTIKAKMATDTSTSDALYVGIADPDSDITAKGMTSNDTITAAPTASEVNGNTMTIAALSLTATTLTQPAARTIAKGINDYVFATASFKATSSGEDALINVITIEDTPSVNAAASEIANVELWADLTSASSTRGDVYETLISTTKQFTTTTVNTAQELAFTLTSTLRVKKGLFVNIAVVADLSAGATTSGRHLMYLDTDTDNLSVTGADTGVSITVTPSGTGQSMLVGAAGVLTVSLDSSSPSAAMILDENIARLGDFKLAASNVEDLDLDSIIATLTGTNTDGVDTFYFYSSKRADGGAVSDPIASASGGAVATVVFADSTVTVPANGNVIITVKALMNNIDGTAVVNGDSIIIDIGTAGDIETTGKASGAAVDSTNTEVAAATHVLYESYPQVVFSSTPAGGNLIPSANTLLAVIDVTAKGNKDITFDGAADPDNGDEDDVFIIQVAANRSDDTVANDDDLTIKDQEGNTLDSITSIDFDATTEFTIDFTTKDFVIPAGQTKKLYIYGDTQEFEVIGDSIQVWLNDGGTALNWSVDYNNGDYSEVAKIFKSDLFGPSWNKP